MATFNFDQVIDRSSSESIKWKLFPADVLPLWVADLDFLSPPAVIDALKARADHGIFGYAIPPRELTDVIIQRMEHFYNWKITPEMVVFLPGIVSGLNQFCHAFAKRSTSVIVQTPVYPPFLSAPGNAGLEMVDAPLQRMPNGRYEIDFEALEARMKAGSSVFILCNPHNPVGRVFQPDELAKIASLCKQYDVILCSDEIHCDLIYSGIKHTPIASLDEEISQRTITFMAPSKTYNVAGLDCAFAVIPNPELRKEFETGNQGLVPHVNIMGLTAAQASFQFGEEWLKELISYLDANQTYLQKYLQENLSELKMYPCEATYLAWIDCSGLNIEGSAQEFFLKECKVGLNPGKDFGPNCSNFVRLNFGCPRSVLEQALERIKAGIKKIR
jgi:cysteine-S-conjugate beta-lyase